MALGLTVTGILLWMHHKVTWKVITVSAVIPALAMTVAFLLAWLIFKRNTKIAKAISFETGIQNSPTAAAFLLISYSGQVFGEMFPLVLFSALFGSLEVAAVAVFYWLAKLELCRKKTDKGSADELEKVEAV